MNTNPIPHGAISPSTRLCTPSISLTILLSSSTPPSLIFLSIWLELKQLGLWGVSCQANSSDPRKLTSLGISKDHCSIYHTWYIIKRRNKKQNKTKTRRKIYFHSTFTTLSFFYRVWPIPGAHVLQARYIRHMFPASPKWDCASHYHPPTHPPTNNSSFLSLPSPYKIRLSVSASPSKAHVLITYILW